MATAIAPARNDRHARALVDRGRDAEVLEFEMRKSACDAADQRDISDLFDAEHPTVDAEHPTVDAESGVVVALARSAEQRRRDVDAALVRLSDGRYGHCEHCGAQIPTVRLLAVPETRYWLPCKTGLERRGARQ